MWVLWVGQHSHVQPHTHTHTHTFSIPIYLIYHTLPSFGTRGLKRLLMLTNPLCILEKVNKISQKKSLIYPSLIFTQGTQIPDYLIYIHGGQPEVCTAQTSFLSLCSCFLCFHWVPLVNMLFLYGEVGTEPYLPPNIHGVHDISLLSN